MIQILWNKQHIDIIDQHEIDNPEAAILCAERWSSSEGMNCEAAAKQLIMYFRGVAKGSIGTAYCMSMGEDPVLEFLSRQEGGMSPSDLAERLGYSRPRMTRILDSLENKGYIVRSQDPNDRRRVIATCTEKSIEHAQDRNTGGVSNLAKFGVGVAVRSRRVADGVPSMRQPRVPSRNVFGVRNLTSTISMRLW